MYFLNSYRRDLNSTEGNGVRSAGKQHTILPFLGYYGGIKSENCTYHTGGDGYILSERDDGKWEAKSNYETHKRTYYYEEYTRCPRAVNKKMQDQLDREEAKIFEQYKNLDIWDTPYFYPTLRDFYDARGAKSPISPILTAIAWVCAAVALFSIILAAVLVGIGLNEAGDAIGEYLSYTTQLISISIAVAIMNALINKEWKKSHPFSKLSNAQKARIREKYFKVLGGKDTPCGRYAAILDEAGLLEGRRH